MDRKDKKSFASLYKKFRLKSEFSTLSEFGNALRKEGLIFEDSLFSRWQNNNRIPNNRNVLLKIIKLFTERGGISSLGEANLFLESAGQGFLTDTEEDFLSTLFNNKISLPNEEINYELLLNSTSSLNETTYFLESQINLLYDLIYQGNPLKAYNKLQGIEKFLLNSELKNKQKRIALLNRLRWVMARCISDICKPGKFLPEIERIKRSLSFALEKNTKEIGGLFWMNSALMRLQILTVPSEKIHKPFLQKCLNLATLALEYTPDSKPEDRIVEHIEIAKIALLIKNRKLFDEHFYLSLSYIPRLPRSYGYLSSMVWDVKARAILRFGKDLDAALENIQIANSFLDSKYQAVDLYLKNTELQILKLSNDPSLIKRTKLIKNRVDFLSSILDNPYQKMRFSNERYQGL